MTILLETDKGIAADNSEAFRLGGREEIRPRGTVKRVGSLIDGKVIRK